MTKIYTYKGKRFNVTSKYDPAKSPKEQYHILKVEDDKCVVTQINEEGFLRTKLYNLPFEDVLGVVCDELIQETKDTPIMNVLEKKYTCKGLDFHIAFSYNSTEELEPDAMEYTEKEVARVRLDLNGCRAYKVINLFVSGVGEEYYTYQSLVPGSNDFYDSKAAPGTSRYFFIETLDYVCSEIIRELNSSKDVEFLSCLPDWDKGREDSMSILYLKDGRKNGKVTPLQCQSGGDGDSGADGAYFRDAYRGEWSPDVQYEEGDLVSHENSIYLRGKTSPPNIDSMNWAGPTGGKQDDTDSKAPTTDKMNDNTKQRTHEEKIIFDVIDKLCDGFHVSSYDGDTRNYTYSSNVMSEITELLDDLRECLDVKR